MAYLTTEMDNGVLVVTLDQPDESVNKLDEQLINEVEKLLPRLQDDDILGMVLISGKKNNFIAGADIAMFKEKAAPDEIEALSRRGNALLMELENCPKPLVAAIHGGCIGGGNEVAMAMHYRVATDHSSTQFSQPEVQLGLLPGGGGTQRLPRLIGLKNALPYLLTGKTLYPHKAKKLGLVDELTHQGALRKAAVAAVRKLHRGAINLQRKRSITDKLLEGNALGRRLVFSQARKNTLKKTNGNMPAPMRIIDCVEKGYTDGKAAGFEAESVGFGELAATAESQAMVNLFFAIQKAKKNPQKKKAREVHKLGILGAGLMGAGIADVSVNNGYSVLLKDQTTEQAVQGKKTVWKNLDKKVRKHIISDFERDRTLSRLTPTASFTGFGNADMVIEAVFEDLDLKKSILQEVESHTSDHCIFASNTSSLPISKIAADAVRPAQVIGMHYFSPVQKMPLLEIIKTDATANWVTATARQVGIAQGKHVIVVNDGPGFYTTRILAPFMNEALMLLEEGISIEQLDRDMTNFGFPVGPAALFDEVGIDVAAHITKVLNPLFSDRGVSPNMTPIDMVDTGYKGRKNDTGFYRYATKKGRKKKQAPNSDVYRFFGGDNRTKLNTQEVQDRMSLAMVNEAAWCLQDAILQSPDDGDLGAVMGLGFPPFLGGPFRYADRLGAAEIVDRLEALQLQYGPRFTPADILLKHAKNRTTFHTE